MLALADPTAEVRELFGYRLSAATWPATTWATWPWLPFDLKGVPGGAGGGVPLAQVHGQVLPATLVPVRLCGRPSTAAWSRGRWRSARPAAGRVGLAGAGPAGGGAGRGPRRPPGRPGPARPRLDLHLGGAQPARLELADALTEASWLVYICNLEARRGRPPVSRPRATWPRSSTTAPACGAVARRVAQDVAGAARELRAFAELGAAVVHAEVAADDHPGRHDAARLATALKELAQVRMSEASSPCG